MCALYSVHWCPPLGLVDWLPHLTLSRFVARLSQVRLEFDHYSEFAKIVMQTIGERLGAKTREMTLQQLLAYFDPDRNGEVDALELKSILQGLDLGLSKLQLQQLMFELGFTSTDARGHPVEVMLMLLQRLPIASREWPKGQAERFQAMLLEIRNMIRQNDKVARNAFNTKLLEIFETGDTDSNGLLSYDETACIIRQLQASPGWYSTRDPTPSLSTTV